MAVVSCGSKPWKGRSASFKLQIGGKSDNSINRTIVEVYQVQTNNPNDSAVIVLSSPLVPQMGIDVHPDYTLALCTGTDATQPSASPYDWLVVATYSTIQPRQPEDNPLARPDIVRWSGRAIVQVVDSALWGGVEDWDGNPLAYSGSGNPPPLDIGERTAIMNTAADLYDPTLQDEGYDLVATVERNVAYVPQWLIYYASYPASVNDATLMFGGIEMDEATLKIMMPNVSELLIENQIQYYKLTMSFAYREDGWDWRVANMGLNEFTNSGTKQPIKFFGVPVATPQMLDENGEAILSGNRADQTYCVFQRPRDDFSVIRLPAR
jgi:hypothetical protein